MSYRILQFVPESLPTFRADVAVLFGKYLPRHGVETHLVGMNEDAALSEQGFASSRRSQYSPSRLRRELSYLGLCWRALWGARRDEIDLIQVRDMVSIGLLALIVARLKGIPFSYWVSFLMSEGRIGRARADLAQRRSLRNYYKLFKGLVERELLYRVVLPRAQHVFVQSDAMRARMVTHGIPAARMTAVPMGVDTELFAQQPVTARRLPGWEQVPLLAYLGSLDPEREIACMIDALALVRREVPDARLLLVGGAAAPQEEQRLRAYAAAAGLAEAVHITGWMPAAQAWQLLVAADVALSYIPRGALLDVSSPTKLLEYLALGLPAVANDSPDQQHVLDTSGAGWLTTSGAAAMAEAVLDVLRDRAAARARAAAGPAYIVSERSYKVLAEHVAHQYHRLARGQA